MISPSRIIPLLVWAVFVGIVYVSDIPPGPSPLLSPTTEMLHQVSRLLVILLRFRLAMPKCFCYGAQHDTHYSGRRCYYPPIPPG